MPEAGLVPDGSAAATKSTTSAAAAGQARMPSQVAASSRLLPERLEADWRRRLMHADLG